MRRLRERRRNKLMLVNVDLRASELDALIRRGHLTAHDRADPAAVTKGLYGFLDKALT